MGELKDIRAQQEELVTKAKELANKLYLAGLGAYSKAGNTSGELVEKYVDAGTKAFGEAAEGKPKALLAGRGLLESTKELIDAAPEKRKEYYERFIAAGKTQRGEKADETNEFVLAGIGAVITAREESEKLFNELVAEGEQRA